MLLRSETHFLSMGFEQSTEDKLGELGVRDEEEIGELVAEQGQEGQDPRWA